MFQIEVYRKDPHGFYPKVPEGPNDYLQGALCFLILAFVLFPLLPTALIGLSYAGEVSAVFLSLRQRYCYVKSIPRETLHILRLKLLLLLSKFENSHLKQVHFVKSL